MLFSFLLPLIIKYSTQWFYSQLFTKPLFTKRHFPTTPQYEKLKQKSIKYATILPVYASLYARLSNRPISTKTRRILTLISAIAPFYDYLFEERRLAVSELYDAIENTNKTPQNSIEECTLCIFKTLAQELSPHQLSEFKQIIKAVHKSEVQSLQQFKKTSTPEELKNLTKAKGITVTALFLPLDWGMTNEEKNTIKELGAWLQLFDDVIDKNTDRQEGIVTLLSSHKVTVDYYRQTVKGFTDSFVKSLEKLPYPQKNKNTFLYHNYLLLIMILKVYTTKYSILPGIKDAMTMLTTNNISMENDKEIQAKIYSLSHQLIHAKK